MSAAPTITENRGPEGWREIAIRLADGKLVAVVTRPITGANWFLHRLDGDRHEQRRFKTRKAAIERAVAPHIFVR